MLKAYLVQGVFHFLSKLTHCFLARTPDKRVFVCGASVNVQIPESWRRAEAWSKVTHAASSRLHEVSCLIQEPILQ